MGLLKILINGIFIVCIIGAVFFTAIFIYGSLFPESTVFNLKEYNPFASKDKAVNASGEVVQFEPNLRFNHNDISYYINPTCPESKKSKFENALFLLSDKTKIITFYTTNEEDADILVGCSKESYEQETNVFVAGEGGPTEYITSKFYPVIKKGKVLLYEEDKCDYPITELHELFHVFGFDHINDSKMIMYPYIDCQQIINPEVIEELVRIYSVKPAAELYFDNVSAVRTGMYLNFAASVRNEGLITAKAVMLELYADNEKVSVFNLETIEFGTGVTYTAQNVKLPNNNVQNVEFKIVTITDELDKNNNVIELGV
ncbi:MAG: matrixin family metalloprotease [Nanoarchaeota archaeon]